MNSRVNVNISRTAKVRDFGLGLIITVGFILVVGYLTTSIVEKKAAQAEAERIAVHLNMVAKRGFKNFPKGNAPLTSFAPQFKKMSTNPMLRMIEKVYALRVWDATGRFVWSSDNRLLQKYPFEELPTNPLSGVLAFKLNSIVSLNTITTQGI